ncbi:MAG: aminotransferase class I/II-fold pyridoxal phosphate-dependent enzyme [Simkaniaceae bacterium]|nr:MAG: aminotransferase class I/II-fold pyridoxal phosphate-dependent enzyme [Simkaniaceae bacterium]
MMEKYHYYQSALEKKREQKEYRQLRCVADLEEKNERSRINFASNDFLGLSQHPYVKKNTIKYVLEWGAGTTPSRLVTEHLECHRSVEEKLSDLVGKEGALLFPSAYQVHDQILSTVLNSRTQVFIDRYCHHGLIQAVQGSGAQVFRYEHNNLGQLSSLLEKTGKNTVKWVVSESLFGIDGELADLKKIGEIAEYYDALTYIDDSNSIGVLGKHGMGQGSHRRGIDLVFGSFGKQSGSFGAYVATNQMMRDYLLAFNPQLIETTMLPPAVLGAISGSLDLIPDMQVERQRIELTARTLREALKENHWDIGNGSSHIIPLLCSSELECEKLSKALLKKSILTTLLKPPFVPQGAARLRLCVTSLHSQEDISYLLKTLQYLSEEPALSIV